MMSMEEILKFREEERDKITRLARELAKNIEGTFKANKFRFIRQKIQLAIETGKSCAIHLVSTL
jgi:hypothetical protein